MRQTRLTGTAFLFLMAATILLSGCEIFREEPSLDPRVRELTVQNTVQGVPPIVDIKFVIPGISNKYVNRVTAEFRSLREPNRPFVAATNDFESLGNNNWQGELPALNLGRYEVKVIATLRTGPGSDGNVTPSITSFIESVTTFRVGPDAEECFNFAEQSNGAQGWVSDGYKQVSDSAPLPNCENNAFWFNGGLYSAFGFTCAPTEQYRVDLVSPDVLKRPGWAQTQGIATTVFWNIPNMQMQSIFIRKDGSAFVPASNGETIFHPQTGTVGSPFTYTGRVSNPEGTVEQVRLRFFGAPLTSAPEGFILVKSVCPIPDRPG
ncbi:MAG: hypothetical protein AB8F65_07575 [Woeseiaceae bacterium]